MNRRFSRILVLAGVAALLASASAVSAQVLKVKPQVNADPSQNIRLGDVATVSGIDAKTGESLLNLIIIPGISEARTLRAEAILMAVIAQVGPGKIADNLQVEGAPTCDIQFASAAPKTIKPKVQVSAKAAVAVPAPQTAQPIAAAPVPAKRENRPEPRNSSPTLAKIVIARIQEDLASNPDDLRINFDTANPLLDQQAPIGRRWVVRPLTRSLLGTVQLEAQMLDGSRVVQKVNVQVQVFKRQRVLIAASTITRGTVVTPSHFRSDEDWFDRAMPTLLLEEKDVIGLEALRDVAAGSKLDQRDFRPVNMAAKSDVVSVIYLNGTMKVQMKGRAVSEGKLHDTIQIKNESTNQVYDAVLIGKRLAVVGGTLTDAQEKLLREAK